MKIPLLIAVACCTVFAQATPLQAKPKSDRAKVEAQVRQLLKSEENTKIVIHELMQSSKSKQMMAKMLKPDAEFRGYYSSASENAGGG